MFCAISRTRDPRTQAATAARAVKGGAIPTSISTSAAADRTAAARSAASALRRFIFQLPAIKGRLIFSPRKERETNLENQSIFFSSLCQTFFFLLAILLRRFYLPSFESILALLFCRSLDFNASCG
jgi:hypothetical protein